MGIGSSGVVNCANTYLGTANYTVADGYVADRTVIVDGNGPAQLNLNFARNEVLDPRITFSRTSNATRTNAQGLIEYAPHNLLTYSEQFDNASWVKSNATVTANAVTAPDGTLTADKLIPDSTLITDHTVNTATVSIGTTYTVTVYAKAAGYNYLFIRGLGLGGSGGARFNLQTGIVEGVANYSSASITALSNGWYRCIATGTALATTGVYFNVSNQATFAAFSGDGTSGIYLWGAQLNIGSLQPYYTTSVKNLLGYSQEFSNAAWTKSNSYVLTNLLTYSQEFDNAAWLKSNVTVTANAVVAPDGTLTADKLVANTVNTQHLAQQLLTPNAGTKYTLSFYVKAAEYSYCLVGFSGGGLIDDCLLGIDLATGISSSTSGAPESTNIVSIGSNWYRVSITKTLPSASLCGLRVMPSIDGISQIFTGDGTSGIYIWGAQLVQGTDPGEYTATTSAATPVQVMGPFGYLGAMKLVEDTATSTHLIQQTPTTAETSIFTTSLYCKAGEKQYVQLRVSDTSPSSGSRAYATFDLLNGTYNVGSITATNVTANIIQLGSGWYRCTLTCGLVVTGTTTLSHIYIANSATASSAPPSYTGDGTSGIYIYGAQLSDSASLDPYSYNTGAAPTSSAYYGPRFDYDPVTLAPKGLLIEEQRINILLNSDTLSTQLVSVTAQAYTLSFYGTGSVALSGAYTGSLVGIGAYPNRVQLTFTPTIGILTLTVTGSVRYANLEAGSFPTSYIPTTSAQVTRAADNASMTGTNFSSWYNQSEGTIYSEWILGGDNISSSVYSISDGSASNLMRSRYNSAGTGIDNAVITSGATVAVLNATNQITTYSSYKNAMAYLINDFARAANTVLVTDNSGATPIVNQINIGASVGAVEQLNGHIKVFKFFSKRFINTYLQSLTQ